MLHLHLSNEPTNRNISLLGATVSNNANSDPTQMTIQLTEMQRVAALRISNQPGLNSDLVELIME